MADLPDYYTLTSISEAEAAGFKGGLAANRSPAPVSRDIYLGTDNHILYVCFIDGTWTGFDAAMLTQGILTLYANMVANAKRITGLADPIAAQDAATRAYVLAQDALEVIARNNAITAEANARIAADALRLLLTGGTMSGAIAMGANKITGLADPTVAQDAATRAYVLARCGLYLPLTGGTLTGDLTIGAHKILTTDLSLYQHNAAGIAIKNLAGTVWASLYLGNLFLYSNLQFLSAAKGLYSPNVDNGYTRFLARDNGVGSVEIARLQGAADPYFAMGGGQEFKFLYSGAMGTNLIMGGFKVTGLGAPAAQNDSLRYGQAEIRNAEIAAGAAIAYAKLNLALMIRNSDVKADAAIVESKLALAQGTQALFDKIGTDLGTHSDLPNVHHTKFTPTEHTAIGDSAPHHAKTTLLSELTIDTFIEIAITQTGDYTEKFNPRATVLFPWSTPSKLTNPAALPTGMGRGAAWSPNGEFLAIAHSTSPYITIYQRSGTTFIKLANPADLPAGTSRGAAWSPNGEFLAIAHDATPFVTIYQRAGATFTKLANPAALPADDGNGVAWSPNGEFLAIAHEATPFVTIYQRAGTTFTKLANPAALPTGNSYSTAWSPNGEFLAIGHSTSRYVTIYQRSGITFTKLTDPADLPAGTGYGTAWSPNGEFLAVAHSTTPYVTIYQRAGTTFTKLANPAALPASTGYSAAWSPNGEFLAIGHSTTPFVTIYQRAETTFTKLTDPADLPAGRGYGAAWSPNGEFLAIAYDATPYVTIYQTASTIPASGVVIIQGVRKEGD